MANWLAQYSAREKSIVVLAVLVMLGLGVHALIVEPYQQRMAELRDSVEQGRADLEWMRSVLPTLPLGDNPVSSQPINGTLANFVDQAVRGQGLSSQLSQMSPVGDDEIRMRYNDVDFNRLISFVARIQSSGLAVKDLRITEGDQAGVVNSNLVLVRR